ncbi:MAG: thioesterase family protein [Myxococcales bacterium]|nr:thioesterase family protein [Myxococcales bacterium]
MRLDAKLREQWHQTPEGWTFEFPTGWMQGRSIFGGFTAASLASLGYRHVDNDRTLRTLSIQLLSPTVPGKAQGFLDIVREGKNITFAQARLEQQGKVTATASLIFSKSREGSVSAPTNPRWLPKQGPAPEGLVDMPYIPEVIPEFIQKFSMRWADGSPPFSEASQAAFSGYCRLREPSGDVEALLGLLDAWPCPSLSLVDRPVAASTVTWTAHILEIPQNFEDWFSFSYETVAGEGGFHTAVGVLHSSTGQLLGWTEQLVALFD